MTWPEYPRLTAHACYEHDGRIIPQPGGPNPWGPVYPGIPPAVTEWVPTWRRAVGVAAIGAGALLALWPDAPVVVEVSASSGVSLE